MRPSRSLAFAASAALVCLAAASSSSKRGLCHVASNKHSDDDSIWTTTPGADLTWYYNYKYEPSDAYKDDSSFHYVPMLWGASESDKGTPFLDSVKKQISGGSNITHVLGFNEPDGTTSTGGSNILPALAASAWKLQIEPLKKLGVKLGAPAVASSQDGFTWLTNWLSACAGGCTPDFIPVHFYGSFEGLASHVGQVASTYPNLTIWVTEWGFPDQGLEDTQSFFNQSIAMLDRWDNITRYSYFGAFRSDVSNVGPNAAMLTEKGKLTDIGSWYLGGVATGNIPHRSAASRSMQISSWGLAVLVSAVCMLL